MKDNNMKIRKRREDICEAFLFSKNIEVLIIKLMMIIKLLLDVSALSSVIFKSCKVTVTWQFE